MNVVGMGVCVNLSRDSSHDTLLCLHPGEAELLLGARRGNGSSAIEVIRFCHHSQRLFKDLPELDRLICSIAYEQEDNTCQTDSLTVG